MVPLALPAISAPTRVSLVPSCLASSGVTPACAVPTIVSRAPARRVLANVIVCSFANVGKTPSQRGLEGEGQEAAVGEQGIGAGVGADRRGRVQRGVAHEVDVLQV